MDTIRNTYCTLDNIFVYKPSSLEEFLSVIRQLPHFLKQHPDVRFLAIDSITYFLREMTDMLKRHEILTKLINQISSMTVTSHLAVFPKVESYIDTCYQSHHQLLK